MLRLLYARAINNSDTAVVIETAGQLLGGVAVMTHMTQTREVQSFLGVYGTNLYPDRMELNFIWKWCEVVDSVDWFERARAWENGPTKQLEAPMKLLGKD